ncbi:site-specific DNA-methyltransferase [Paratractidigestivibacter sp.]|uniref:site-specific DNA-methyltransferase n=1 Tax=Paratractidigestivibacter sp. TaxID=2847316 RepID=UPI002AC8BF07|nr:site-specific DNA-methyltransferase [Paratractidigestivibacter sp.]
MDKINPTTPDLTQENIEKIAALFPDVVTEATDADGNVVRAIDFDALKDDLSSAVVDGPRERYQFTWPGKREAKLEARRPTKKVMRPNKEKSKDWDTTQNLYIEGDNLEALKIMRETYAGKVKLIYIDPPYNTGHDFVYDDDFSQTREEYAEQSGDYDEQGGRLVANLESNGRFHSDWCSMMYPRLLLARDLLSSDGAIFISIDDNESANLRKLCDEVFGASCFVGDIAWQKTYSPRNDSKGIPAEVEHILAYSKSAEWIPGRLARTEEMDERYASPDGDPRPWSSGDAAAPGAATHQGMVYAIQHPVTGELLYPPNGRHRPFGGYSMLEIMNGWAEYEFKNIHDEARRAEICGISVDEVRKDVEAIVLKSPCEETYAAAQKRYDEGNWPRLYFTGGGKGGMRLKRYLDTMDGKMPTNLWPYSEVGHTDEAKKGLKKLFGGSAPFDTPKPVRLLDRILTIASEPDSIVVDFFSGSATTAEAVMRKNAEDGGARRFVLVQLPEEVSGSWGDLCAVGEERIRRAGTKVVEEVNAANVQLELGAEPRPVPDVGFRVLEVAEPAVRDEYAEPAQYEQSQLGLFADNAVESASDLDVLFQALPAFRIPYSATITERELGGKRVYDVNEGQLIACFDEGVDAKAIEAIAKERPLYALFRDACFAGDADVSNLEELFKTFSPDTIRKVI